MEILYEDTWIMFIAVTVFNALILKFRSKKYISENPALEEGYDKYIKGILFYGNIPWVIIMIGNISGMTHSTFDYFNPRSMNPIVLIFHFSIIVLWILSVRWIYFRNGAEFIETHPGLFMESPFSGNTNLTSTQIKLFFPLVLLSGIVGMIMMWLIDIPSP